MCWVLSGICSHAKDLQLGLEASDGLGNVKKPLFPALGPQKHRQDDQEQQHPRESPQFLS